MSTLLNRSSITTWSASASTSLAEAAVIELVVADLVDPVDRDPLGTLGDHGRQPHQARGLPCARVVGLVERVDQVVQNITAIAARG